ncbi:MAG: KilA-N domain-containing protein, partial [Bacteroidota bacterium]
MSELLKQFEYQGQYISFEFTDLSKMVNATQMAKPFKGKLVADFLRLKTTKEYILLLEERYGDSHIADSQLNREVLRVIKGGLKNQGTWMDEKLALKFAAWLSPRFELWVYDRIYELLTTGQTQLEKTKSLPVIDALRLITDQLEAQANLNTEVRQELDEVGERLQNIEAKITSTDANYFT